VHLDLSVNDIGPAGALQLVKSMKDASCFSILNFADCKMKAKGTSKKKTILLEREFFNLFPNIYVQT
jgi:hypothetical protein